jgi:hypothetical protein
LAAFQLTNEDIVKTGIYGSFVISLAKLTLEIAVAEQLNAMYREFQTFCKGRVCGDIPSAVLEELNRVDPTGY